MRTLILFIFVLGTSLQGLQAQVNVPGESGGIHVSTKGVYHPFAKKHEREQMPDSAIITGADRTDAYLDYLKGKNVGMVINQTSVMSSTYQPVVDSLLKLGIGIKKIFGPEHGFRGNSADGAKVGNGLDSLTGLPVISLYGKHNKPSPDDLKGIDIMVFDIQDVGARFYTFISTLHYVMEACAENGVELLILDRPNPNGNYVDGPVLDTAFRSFVGMDAVPVVHGMTIAEYARMINGEGWLSGHKQCRLKIITMLNYVHASAYTLPINPSPNLSSSGAILLYPSLCFFEGTVLSVGRGTPNPFQTIGHPLYKGIYNKYTFTPHSIPGVSDNPPLKDVLCYGIDLRTYQPKGGLLDLSLLIKAYKDFPDKTHFFTPYFDKLAGTDELRKQIIAGASEDDIRLSWEPALSQYKLMRKKYLLYK